MEVQEGWARNGEVKLHFIQSNADSVASVTPVVYVHSAFGSAEGFLPEMRSLAPRRCVSLTLRGRGNSDAPESGYSFDDNVSDLEAVVNHLGLTRFCLMAWSIGVTYSIAYTSRHQDRVSGLILLDYQARHPKWPAGWAERWMSEPTIRDSPSRVRGLRGLERESAEVELWDDLEKIKCPVLLIGGGRSDALLKPEHVEKYRDHLQRVDVVIFENSGHNVSEPDYERFILKIKSFLDLIG